MKTELFKKVYIHSEDDLPKETGRYLGHEKCFKSQDLLDSYHYDKDDKDFCCDWLNTFDWYLLPVPLPSDKEIKQWIKKDRQSLIDCEVATSGELMERFHGREEGVAWLKSRLTDK